MDRGNPKNRVVLPWSDLPPELLHNVGKRLGSDIDTRRFRAVCHSWRSSTPPYTFPTIKLPFPFDAAQNPDPEHSGAYFILTERIVYRIQLPRGKSSDFWIVKLESAGDGKMRIINPVTHWKIEIPPAVEMPKVLNLWDFDISEVCKAYALRYVNSSKPDESDDYYDYRDAKKVAFSANVETGEYVVMAIDLESRLWQITSGAEKWTYGDPPFADRTFYDVTSINGQLHAVSASGDIWGFDSKFRWWRTGRYNGRLALKRRLVELCNGELVLVEEMRKAPLGPLSGNFLVKQTYVDIGIYAQTKVLKKWLDVRAMLGFIIVVSDDCSFSVPTTMEKLKAARVFYTDRYGFYQPEFPLVADEYTCYECDCTGFLCYCMDGFEIPRGYEVKNRDVKLKRLFKGFYGQKIGVCDCKTGKTGTALLFPEYASIFWPPPSWLSRI